LKNPYFKRQVSNNIDESVNEEKTDLPIDNDDNDENNQNNKVFVKKFNINDFMKQKIQDKLKSIPLSSTKKDDYQIDM